jgi:hypothetical protein
MTDWGYIPQWEFQFDRVARQTRGRVLVSYHLNDDTRCGASTSSGRTTQRRPKNYVHAGQAS